MTDETPDLRSGLPATPPGGQPGEPDPRIGHDEWVARAGRAHADPADRQEQFGRVPLGRAGSRSRSLVLAFVPVITSNGYIIRVGADTLIYALLALGLNVAVGWAGLLDLAYVAFFGFGAYAYALVSSDKFGQHWPTYAVAPRDRGRHGVRGARPRPDLVAARRRLPGDRDPLLRADLHRRPAQRRRISLLGGVLGVDGSVDITGGPNGIAGLDSFHIGSHQASSVRSYYWIALVMATVVFFFFVLLDDSRPGRAWRSLREDNLAAERWACRSTG